MKATTLTLLGLGLGISLVAAQSASAQNSTAKSYNTYGGTYTVTQTEAAGGNYNTGSVLGTESNDTLQTLYAAGKATITFVSGPLTSSDNLPASFVDAGGGASGAGNKIQMQDRATTITQFNFNDPAAAYGETLTNIILSTLATGGGSGTGRGLYDVDFAYSTDGVTFTKFLTASDLSGLGTQYEQLTANGFGGSITGVKALQLTARNVPLSNPGANNYGTYFSELDVDATPSPAPAAAPEPSQAAALGIGIFGLGALALKARKRRVA